MGFWKGLVKDIAKRAAKGAAVSAADELSDELRGKWGEPGRNAEPLPKSAYPAGARPLPKRRKRGLFSRLFGRRRID